MKIPRSLSKTLLAGLILLAAAAILWHAEPNRRFSASEPENTRQSTSGSESPAPSSGNSPALPPQQPPPSAPAGGPALARDPGQSSQQPSPVPDATFPNAPDAGQASLQAGSGKSPSGGGAYVENQVLVRVRADVSDAAFDQVLAQALPGAAVRKSLPGVKGLKSIRLAAGQTVPAALAALQKTGVLLYAEPDYIWQINAIPDDANFAAQQWNMNNTGQNIQASIGTADMDIDAPEAWDIRTDSGDTIIAVIDTGARYTHQDLAPNMWKNPGETGVDGGGNDKATNGVDDDGNGYIDDVYGIDPINNDCDPMDDHGHGSHCAGIIGAKGNNGVGLAGVAWTTRIMALKAGSASGSVPNSDSVECISYAISMGADIISASWGGRDYSQAVRDSIKAASDAGIVFVTGAGNDGQPSLGLIQFPAAYPLGNIVTAGAHDNKGALSSFSNYGADVVSLFAPGTWVYSCWKTSDTSYQPYSGTSMATPHISGALALLRAQFPLESPADWIHRLQNGVDRPTTTATIATANAQSYSGGRMNLAKALSGTSSTRPRNDDFSSRIPILANTDSRVLLTNATAEASEPAHGGSPAVATVWYEWKPTTSGNATLDTANSDGDTAVAIYTGTSLAALTLRAQNDDNPAGGVTTSRTTFSFTANTTYVIAFATKQAPGMFGTGIIRLNTPPANDNFADATLITTATTGGVKVTITGNSAGATKEAGEPATTTENAIEGSTGLHSIWYRWTAPAGIHAATMSTVTTGFDTLLGVYTGSSVDALTKVAANDDWDGNTKESYATFRVIPGTTYHIMVDGFRSGSLAAPSGPTKLNITPVAAPANDNFANATVLPGLGNWTGSTLGANYEPGEPQHDQPTPVGTWSPNTTSVWWKWTPTTSRSNVTVRLTAGTFPNSGGQIDYKTYATQRLAIYTGSSLGALTPVSSTTSVNGTASSVTMNATAGTTYYFAVANDEANMCSLKLDITSTVAAANDTFANRTALPEGNATTSGDNFGATTETGEPLHANASAPGRSIWWRFDATASSYTVEVSTEGSVFDTVLGVYTGTAVNGLTAIATNDDAPGVTKGYSKLTFVARKGTSYAIAVSSKSTAVAGGITLSITTTPTNVLPEMSATTISPVSGIPYSDDTIVVTSATATDVDGDPVSFGYSWEYSTDGRNWTADPSRTSATLTPGDDLTGKFWRARVSAADAGGYGPGIATSAIGVDRRPPSIARHGQAFSYDSELPIAPNIAVDRDVMFTEICYPGSQKSQWIELLVLRPVDLRGWRFTSDYSLANTSNRYVEFASVPEWANVPAGTLITIYDGGTSMGYSTVKDPMLPADDSVFSDNRVVVSSVDSRFFTLRWVTSGGITGNASWPAISGDGKADAHIIQNAGGTEIDAVGGRTPLLGTGVLASGKAYRFAGDFNDGIDTDVAWTTVSTASTNPGTANSDRMNTFINALAAGTWSNPPAFRVASGSSLPNGLTLDPVTGLVSGTPDVAAGGLYRITLERYTAGTTTSRAFDLLVADAAGVLRVPAGRTWTLNGPVILAAGMTLVNNGTINLNGFTITQAPALSYASWIAGFVSPEDTGASADLDGDGANNLLEYAAGTDPDSGADVSLPTHLITSVGQDSYLSLTFRRRTGTTDITYTVEAAGSLTGPWTTLNPATQTVGIPTPDGEGFETVTLRDTVSTSSGNSRFLRLRVSLP